MLSFFTTAEILLRIHVSPAVEASWIGARALGARAHPSCVTAYCDNRHALQPQFAISKPHLFTHYQIVVLIQQIA
jgi:hypothetical protein